ncbi:MAG: coproporphyrinogen III oxidase, partial [Ottowia sp.]
MSTPDTAAVRPYLIGLQTAICTALEDVEQAAGSPTRFLRDAWQKPAGERLQGDGITQIMEGGAVFERAGIG